MSPEQISDSSVPVEQVESEPVPTRLLPLPWELFCADVALGVSQAESARNAGFSAETAPFLMQKPEIRERINELRVCRQQDRGGVASKVWAEAYLIRVALGLFAGVPATVDLETGNVLEVAIKRDWAVGMQAVMNFCKVRGYIVERKQVANARVDFGRVGRDELGAALAEHLGELSPQDQATIKRIASGGASPGDLERPARKTR